MGSAYGKRARASSPASDAEVFSLPGRTFLKEILADYHNQVQDANPDTVYANSGQLLYDNNAGAVELREALIHLATPIPPCAVLWALLNETENENIYTPAAFPKTIATGSGCLLECYPVTADWDPAAVTWNTKPAVGAVKKKDIWGLVQDVQGLDAGTLWLHQNVYGGSGDVEWPGFYWPNLATITYGFLLKLVPRGQCAAPGADHFHSLLSISTLSGASRSRVLYNL